MNKLVIRYIVCLSILSANNDLNACGCLAAETGFTKELSYEDWAPTHYKLYDTRGRFMSPERALELLQELAAIYAPYDDAQTNGRKGRVARLLQLTERDPAKCTREYLQALEDLDDYNTPYRRTLAPYICSHTMDYLDMCEENLVPNLHKAVDSMNPDYREDIKKLVNATYEIEYDGYQLDQHKLLDSWMHYGHLVEGLLEFLVWKLDGKEEGPGLSREVYVKQKHGYTKFKEMFHHIVSDMCDAWIALSDPICAFKKFRFELTFNHEENEWIFYRQYCHFIRSQENRLIKKVYRQFKRKTSMYFPELRQKLHMKLRKINIMDPYS